MDVFFIKPFAVPMGGIEAYYNGYGYISQNLVHITFPYIHSSLYNTVEREAIHVQMLVFKIQAEARAEEISVILHIHTHSREESSNNRTSGEMTPV